MIYLYQIIFFKPIFNALILLYNVVGDVGVAIIFLTLIVRVIIFPITMKSIKSQKALQEIQPKLNALKEKYKTDKQALAKATMELYKQEKVNPASSCLPLVLQLPIFIALYRALLAGLKGGGFEFLYPFVHNPGHLNPLAFHLIDLTHPNLIIAFLAGISQFAQTAMLSHNKPKVKSDGAKDEAMLAMMNKQMLYVMPAMTVLIGVRLPGGVILYWLITNMLTIAQQYFFLRKKSPPHLNPLPPNAPEQSSVRGRQWERK